MAEPKTQENDASVTKFVSLIADPSTQADCHTLIKLMQAATSASPKMWGTSIIGFGTQHLVYESGREIDALQIGFSPRKGTLTLYGVGGAWQQHPELLDKLGKHTTGKGCLYIKRLSDIDEKALATLLKLAVKGVNNRTETTSAKGSPKTKSAKPKNA